MPKTVETNVTFSVDTDFGPRLGFDDSEGIYFDRTKPVKGEVDERGQLYEECDPVEVAENLEADLTRLRDANATLNTLLYSCSLALERHGDIFERGLAKAIHEAMTDRGGAGVPTMTRADISKHTAAGKEKLTHASMPMSLESAIDQIRGRDAELTRLREQLEEAEVAQGVAEAAVNIRTRELTRLREELEAFKAVSVAIERDATELRDANATLERECGQARASLAKALGRPKDWTRALKGGEG